MLLAIRVGRLLLTPMLAPAMCSPPTDPAPASSSTSVQGAPDLAQALATARAAEAWAHAARVDNASNEHQRANLEKMAELTAELSRLGVAVQTPLEARAEETAATLLMHATSDGYLKIKDAVTKAEADARAASKMDATSFMVSSHKRNLKAEREART